MANKLFLQEKKVAIGGANFTSPSLSIDFVIGFDTESDGNNGTIEIFNLSKESIRGLEEDEKVMLTAGYDGDLGIIIIGDVKKVESRWEGQDRITEIIVGEDVNEWLNKSINMTWGKGTSAERVAQDIIDHLGFTVGALDLPDGKYEGGKTFSTTCKRALEQIAEDFDSKLYTARGHVYLLSKTGTVERGIKVSPSTGLAQGIERDGDYYHAKTLLDYRIKPDVILDIDAEHLGGRYRVINGEHISSGDQFFTEVVMEKHE